MYWKIYVQLHPMNLVDMPVNYNDNLHDLSVFQAECGVITTT